MFQSATMPAPAKRIPWLGFIVSVLAVGLPYWLIPYGSREFSLPSALYGPQLCVPVLAAALAVGSGAAGFWKGLALLGASIPAAVMLRVVAEVIIDPTSHNLWPFEIIISAMVSAPCALAGAFIGWIAWQIRGRIAEDH
jgi:hypothetical protein